MIEYMQFITNNKLMKVLIVFVALDSIFGVLRAIKERKLNSTIGIDGIIRKIAMITSVIALAIVDDIVTINLISFINEDVRVALDLKDVGINELFSFLYIVFEALSVIKNAILCRLPIPKKLQAYLEKIMRELTNEIKPEKQEVYEKMVDSIAETSKEVYENYVKREE